MLDLGSFELEIQKAVVIFEISTLRFVKYIKFCEKMEMSKCDTKMPYLGILGQEF